MYVLQVNIYKDGRDEVKCGTATGGLATSCLGYYNTLFNFGSPKIPLWNITQTLDFISGLAVSNIAVKFSALDVLKYYIQKKKLVYIFYIIFFWFFLAWNFLY